MMSVQPLLAMSCVLCHYSRKDDDDVRAALACHAMCAVARKDDDNICVALACHVICRVKQVGRVLYRLSHQSLFLFLIPSSVTSGTLTQRVQIDCHTNQSLVLFLVPSVTSEAR
jgi:hypothetical protein